MKNNGGFTLVEIIVAIALFTTTMVYGLSFFTYGTKSAVRAEVRREALLKCNTIIEKHKGELYTAASVTLPYTPAAVYAGPGNKASIVQRVTAYTHPSIAGVSCCLIETTATASGTANRLVRVSAIQAPQFPTYY